MNKETEKLYDNIGNWDEETHGKVWNKWLWGTDCNAQPIEQCWDMNEMHIYGILCCLEESENPSSDICQYSLVAILNESQYPELTILHLHGNKKLADFTLRELIDQIECLQLNWGKFIGSLLDNRQLDVAFLLLKGIASHIGNIAHHAFSSDGDMLDDPQYMSMLPKLHHHEIGEFEVTYAIISRKALRQAISILHILFRILYIIQKTEFTLPVESSFLKKIVNSLKQHHIESSMDFFNVFQQMVYLAPAMRLVYRTNFAGMYNDVSQVIYFHYPKFSRQPQISLNDIPYSNIHLLPLISQLIPEIPIYYDDDTYIPGLTDASLKSYVKTSAPPSGSDIIFEDDASNQKIKDEEWVWLVSCGEMFLVRAIPSPSKVYIAKDHSLLHLLGFYLMTTGRKFGDDMLDSSDLLLQTNDLSLTAHGHLQLHYD